MCAFAWWRLQRFVGRILVDAVRRSDRTLSVSKARCTRARQARPQPVLERR
ncbi:hypothetical protein XCV3764 [Xanthomonas euvesicatoria pv. vesicatoria str. 85-10]|uniref:Uncharacterized protein n=1 Tax=Xanthomonas euvesicatoria pv. vesicatoria (strain 85-10) TaxID=316273 RepID=Q3BP18_XANE5|nr:hypothetical protein XCV3764 [Xanthomonas euvesicatoria pv. vesicatoria str. 85-10]